MNPSQSLNTDDPSSKDFGKITSIQLQNGPVSSRSCTDLLCLLLFIAFLLTSTGIQLFAWSTGSPQKLLQPYDVDHNGCGLSGTSTQDYPYVYFAAPLSQSAALYTTVCVKQCPVGSESSLQCYTNSLVKSCTMMNYESNQQSSSMIQRNTTIIISNNTNNILMDSTSQNKKVLHKSKIKQSLEQKSIEFFNPTNTQLIYPTSQIGTACLPEVKQLFNDISTGLSVGFAYDIVNMFQQTWTVQIYCFLIALVIAFIFIHLLKWFTAIFTWLLILLGFVVLAGLGTFLLVNTKPSLFGNTISQMANNATLNNQELSGISNSIQNNQVAFEYLGFILIGLAAIYLILVFCNCTNIRVAIAVTQASTIYMDDNISCLLIPIIHLLTVVIYFVIWTTGIVYLMSTGTLDPSANLPPYGQFLYSNQTLGLFAFQLFALFWMVAFFGACTEFVLGSSVAIWYFKQMDHPVITSYQRLARYHVGSIAFGSLLIAVLWFLQFIFYLLQKQVKDKGGLGIIFLGADNPAVKCIFCVIDCCLDCFTRFIEFINKNAYTIIAFEDTNFCTAAKESFQLSLRNIGTFATLNALGDMYIFLGRIFIGGITGLFGYLLITETTYYQVDQPIYATVVFTAIGGIVGSVFMSLFGHVSDSIVVVYVLDSEIQRNHHGKSVSPNTPEPLQRLIMEVQQQQ